MKYLFIFLSLLLTHTKLATSQIYQQPSLNFLNRPETMVESTNSMSASNAINEPPCNSVAPIPNVINPTSTTIITDCSPTICKSLADTVQLMIACNLLQNSLGGSEMAMQLAAPIINDVMTSPMFSCGCDNSISSDILCPNLFSPNVITPDFMSSAAATHNFIPSNAMTPNFVSSLPTNKPLIFDNFSPSIMVPNLAFPIFQNTMPQGMLNPNLVNSLPQLSPNLPSNLISPNVISPYFFTPNVISADMAPSSTRMVNPPNICSNNVMPPNILSGVPNRGPPNVPLGVSVSNTKGLMNTLMSILGNIQG